MLIDAQEGVTDQDTTVLGHVLDAGRALVVAVNKWDDLPRDQRETVQRQLERKLEFVPWAPIVFISALHGSGLRELMQAVNRAHASATWQFNTHDLTEVLGLAFESFQRRSAGRSAAALRPPGRALAATHHLHGSRLAAARQLPALPEKLRARIPPRRDAGEAGIPRRRQSVC